MSLVLSYIIAGIITGGLYALLAVGLNLIFGVLKFINVAHGDMLTVGAFSAILAGSIVSGQIYSTVPFAFLAVCLIGIIIARLCIMRLAVNGEFDERRGLVLTLGLSMFIGSLLLVVFGPQYQSVPGLSPLPNFQFAGVTFEGQRVLILVGSLVLTAALFVFLRFSLMGMAIRATAENPEAAQANGIDIRWTQTITFALGSALAGAAGALVAPITYAFPAMGFAYTIYAFIVVVIGGLGSLWGALVAGYLLGIAESLSVLLLPPGYNAAIGPVLMLVVLTFRPQGLFGVGQRIV